MADIEGTSENWLPCSEWSGEGDDLPTGLSGMPGIFAHKLVRSVIILDAESEEGIKEIKKGDYNPAQMDIVDVTINANSLSRILALHPKGFTFTAAGGQKFSREAWRVKYGTDALHLMAIRELMKGMHIKPKEVRL